ncbi:MAG: PAS domain-containing protein [Bacteroidota bacterium]
MADATMDELQREHEGLRAEIARLRAEVARLEADVAYEREQLVKPERRDHADRDEKLLREIEQQRQFLQELISHATIGMAVVKGRDYVFELVNPAYLAVVGAQGKAIVGLPMAQALAPHVAAGEKFLLDAVYANDRVMSVREYQAPINNHETYWDIDHVPLHDGDQRVERILIIAREVTEDVQARRRIALSADMERSTQTLKTLIDIMPAGIVVSDGAGHIIMENDHSRRLMEGPSTGDAYAPRGRYELLYLNGQPFPVSELPMPRALQEGEVSEDIEILIRFDDGRETIMMTSGSPVRNENGEIVGAVAVMMDITERKVAERERESLLQSVEHQRRLLEATMRQMPGAIIIAEAPSGRPLLSNDRLRDYLLEPFGAGDIEGYGEYQGLHLDGTPLEAHDWPLARAIEHSELVTNELVTLVRSDQSRLVLSISASPVHDSEGNVVAAVTTMYEVDPTTFTPKY